MKIAESKLTAQGQISVPAEVRRKLGLSPGSVLEWIDSGETITIKRAGKYTFEDIHRTLFPNGPPDYVENPRDVGVAKYVRERYGRKRRARD